MFSECTYCIVVCALVLERKNLIASPFTSPLKILLGWEEEKCRYWKVLVVLKCVLISRWFVVLNFPPLKMFKSRNSMRSLLMLHVNLRVSSMCFVKPI